jgi:hypothetical protein
MPDFSITLKNEKVKQYERIAFFVILINLVLFIYLSLQSADKSIRIAAIGGAIVIFITLSIDYFLTSVKNNEGSPYKLIALYGISMAWWKIGFWWVGIICALIGLLFMVSKRPLLVKFFSANINYPSFPQKNIEWQSVNNIILKDGLLTIDLKNNKFMQQAIDETKTSINEQEFNDFCQQQLNK